MSFVVWDKSIPSKKVFLCSFLFFSSFLFSQATVPVLNLQTYDPTMMNEVYGQSYFMNSLSSWSEEVAHYQGLIRASWEGAADRAINQYVATITTSDAYNSVAAYQDYVRLSLRSQEEAALNKWEHAANLDMLTNQASFVARLNTGKVDELYLQRVGMQNMLRPTDAEQSANTLRSNIVTSANQWQMDFDTSFQEGVNDFSNVLSNMQQRYNALITNLDESDARFQNNLTAIDRYKNAVKEGIRTILGRFDTMLAAECNQNSPCTFKEPHAGLNAAGETLKEFVREVRAVLNNPAIDTTNVLTRISSSIRDFLQTQTTNASNQLTNYTNRTNTNQMFSTQSGFLEPNGGSTSVTVADVHGSGRTIADIANRENIKVWNADGTNGRFSGIDDVDFRTLLFTMAYRTTADLEALINAKLGSGQSATLLAWNIYTDWNDAHNTSYLGGQRVAYLTADHLQGNYHHETNKEDTLYWIANRGFIDREQMGKIGYELLFKMHDSVAASQAIYWSGNHSALSGELGTYNRDVLPAIQNWESQVTSYNQYYKDWKTQSDQLKANAKLEYDKSVAELNEKKAKWLHAMETQHQEAMVSWGTLYEKADQIKSAADLKLLAEQVALKVEGTDSRPGIATDTDATMDRFTGQIDAFAKTKFSSGVTGAVSTGNYSVLGAVDEKQMVGNLMVGNKDISEVFGKTSNGVYQFTQLLSINGNNEYTARQEQVKLANQMAYSINWDSRWAAKLDDNGNFVSDGNLEALGITEQMASDYLTKLKNYNASIKTTPSAVCLMGTAEYDSCTTAAKKLSEEQAKNFKETFSNEIAELAKKGLEFQNGKIVRSLTKKENDLLGIDTASVASGGTAMTKPKARAANFGTCYLNPDTTECKALLKQDFTTTFDANGVTLSRVISNGNIKGRDEKGYTSGNQTENKYIKFSQMKPVMAPTGKSLFDVWETSDWTNVENQANAISTDFFEKGLVKTQGNLTQSTALIRDLEAKNETKFQSLKKAKETEDALVRDLVIAYLSGGMAGVQGAIKSKVEDQINTSIATAWARASGADESQIGLLTQALSFMKGKVAERKIKSQQATNNLQNVGTALVATATAFGNAALQFGAGAVAFASGNYAAAGTAFAGGFTSVGQGFVSMGNTATALVSTSQGAISTGVFLAGGNTIVTGTAIGAYREVAGDAAADRLVDRTSGAQTRLAEIKAERESMLQSNVTQAVATATGLPAEVIGNLITDYKGAKDAKKVRNAVNANPIANVTSQVVGAVGGIIKTAIVATGVPERDIQRALSDGNRILYAGSGDTNLRSQSAASSNQMLGMKAPGTSYTSATPTLKDQKGLIKELGQRAAVDALSVGMSADEKAVLNAAFRKGYAANEQKKADKKAQTEAIRSTAITAITTAVTLGASGIANAVTAAGQALTATGNVVASSVGVGLQMIAYTPQIMAATIQTTVQVIDGSRNGRDGMLAGVVNGVIGGITASGGLDFGSVKGVAGNLISNSTLGLGVTYDRQNGYGGMIGLGGAKGNVSVSFSQRGNTSINASVDTNRSGLQVTGSTTTNGEQTVGLNYNASNRGPRQGWNVGANYDLNGGGASANIGYTDPRSALGITSTVDRNGLSTSSQYNGNNIGTNTADGYTAEEFNWAQNNINNAQNRTDEIRQRVAIIAEGGSPDLADRVANNEPLSEADQEVLNRAQDRQLLTEAGHSEEYINHLSEADRQREVIRVTPREINTDGVANVTMAVLGSTVALFGFMGLGGNGNSQTPNGNQTANNDTPGRRREDGEEVTDNVDLTRPPQMPEDSALIPTPEANPGTDGESKTPSKAPEPPESVLVQTGGSFRPIPDKIQIQTTEFRITEQQNKEIREIRNKLENTEIKEFNLNKMTPQQVKVLELQSKIEANENTIQSRIEANTVRTKYLEGIGTPQKVLEKIWKENNEAIRKIAMENNELSKFLKKETLVLKIQEDPILGKNFKANDPYQSQALSDLFYAKDKIRQAAAASFLFENNVKLGKTEPFGNTGLVNKEIQTNVDPNLQPGEGYTRVEPILGYKLPMPGIPDGNVSSGFGTRNDPTTGEVKGHGAIDVPTPEGTRIASPYKVKIIEAGGTPSTNLYEPGYGQKIDMIMLDNNGNPTNFGYRIAHNSKILVNPGDIVEPGQAISLSGNSGRSTNPHTHVEILMKNKDGKYVKVVPNIKILEQMKKEGIAK